MGPWQLGRMVERRRVSEGGNRERHSIRWKASLENPGRGMWTTWQPQGAIVCSGAGVLGSERVLGWQWCAGNWGRDQNPDLV